MEMYNGTKENMGRKYDMFAHFVIKDDSDKDITIYVGEEFNDRGVCYLIADIESRYILFASIPDYTDYYKMVKFEPGANEIHNKFNDKDIFGYIDMDETLKSEIFDNIEILDFTTIINSSHY